MSIVGSDISLLRRWLLVLVLLSSVGLFVELLLLGHYEDRPQWIPLVLLVAAFLSTSATLLRPSRVAVRIFQFVMLASVVAGVAGVYLHFGGNVEFEIEREGALRGWELFREAVMGATPTLAPGALAQLGLLGLACSFRHPALATLAPTTREQS